MNENQSAILRELYGLALGLVRLAVTLTLAGAILVRVIMGI